MSNVRTGCCCSCKKRQDDTSPSKWVWRWESEILRLGNLDDDASLAFAHFFLLLLLDDASIRPYPEQYILNAQVFSIIATLPSVINMVTLCFGLFAMIWFQFLCCRRQTSGTLQLLVFLSIFNAMGMMCAGLFVSFHWGPYLLDDPDVNYLMLCCAVCAFLWVFLAFRMVWFLESGDHAKHEQRLDEETRRRLHVHDIESSSEESGSSIESSSEESGSSIEHIWYIICNISKHIKTQQQWHVAKNVYNSEHNKMDAIQEFETVTLWKWAFQQRSNTIEEL